MSFACGCISENGAASCPPTRLAAVTNLILFFGLYGAVSIPRDYLGANYGATAGRN
ncbi:MAG: hypothetical protein NUW37_14295 [Planctomycetes bacterium]|nr:hypothetical protein [Planctomycetota bacterium]